MRIPLLFLIFLFLTQSCQTKIEQDKVHKSILKNCDEIDITYYAKDTFTYKNIDTAAINFFSGLITEENETLTDTCETSGQIIYKNKGQEIFTVQFSTKTIKDSVSCEYVTYFLGPKRYRHRLTYRLGMALDGIYWRKVDPLGNPSEGLDTTKFKYEEKRGNR